VKHLKSAAIALAVVLLAALAAWADVLVTLRDGREIRTDSVTYDGARLKLADGTVCTRDEVKRIALIHEGQEQRGADSGAAEDVQDLLDESKEATRRFPDAKMILLVDYGREEKRSNGTWLLRYRTTAKILHPEMLSMATQGLFYEKERERPKIAQARSIDPDGTVHEYDPASVKISEPSREDVYFGRGEQMTYQIPGVKVGSIVDFTHELEVFNPYDPDMFFTSWFFASTDPFVHSRIEVVMPRNQELYYFTRNMPAEARKPKVLFGQDSTTYIWEMKNQDAVTEEPYMPPVGDVVPYLECSPFKDWSHIKKWASDRLLTRMKPTETLTKLVGELTQDMEDTDRKIAALYHYVQRNIEYISAKGSIASDMCGHPACETFASRRGDCIDCAILLSTLLRIAGVEAYPVWVNTNDSVEITRDIPNLGGNHAITEMVRDNRIFYLDPTASNYRYPAIREDDHGVYAINPILARISGSFRPDGGHRIRDRTRPQRGCIRQVSLRAHGLVGSRHQGLLHPGQQGRNGEDAKVHCQFILPGRNPAAV
jgi:transglutaminase-like putative cysteine protease